MEQNLDACIGITRQKMGVNIAKQQTGLEKQHTGGPHCRTSPVPGQNEASNDRLYLKEEKGADKNCDRKRHYSYPM